MNIAPTLCAHLITLAAFLGASLPARAESPPIGPRQTTTAVPAIPLDQLGAEADNNGGGAASSITPTRDGAKLRALMQDLEGLWITSKADEDLTKPNRFRLMATAIGQRPLASTGIVRADQNVAVWLRPGLVEEYRVSTDGVRQDFLVLERAAGSAAGRLTLDLGLTGATAQAAGSGAKITVSATGRELAYSRLRVTDATGKDLPAYLEVTAPDRLRVVVEDSGALYPVRIDPTFSDADWVALNDGMPGANGAVNALAVDASGNLYAGGEFTVIGGAIANCIAKWDGNSWIPLSGGMQVPASYPGYPVVNALAVSGNDLYAGGRFTTAGGTPCNSIAKWNGSSWSALGSGMNDYSIVYSLAVNGSDLYAGGSFTSAGGTPANYMARWDGSAWSALGSGTSGYVLALAASGSDLYAAGVFGSAGGISASGIAKWDGSAWTALGNVLLVGEVRALAIKGHELYAGGSFYTLFGTYARNIAKWDGSTWSALVGSVTFDSGSPFVESVHVAALAVVGEDLYVGGLFTAAGTTPGVPNSGFAAKNIVRWNGTAWSQLGSGIADGANEFAAVRALVGTGSELYVGGEFSTAGGSPADNIASWNDNAWSALNGGVNSEVFALAASAGNLYAGGQFTMAGDGTPASRIAMWNGSFWSALGSGMNGPVRALAISGEDLYAGGTFTTAGDIPANNIAKWNGAAWSALGDGIVNADPNGSVNAITASEDDLYAGGLFTAAGGIAASNIARWASGVWSHLGGGVTNEVKSLAVIGKNVIVGGLFTTAGDASTGYAVTDYIARWDGVSWSALGSGMNGPVYAMATSGGDIYAAGKFTTAGGSPAANIAKWNGSTWSALGNGTSNTIYALAVSGGDIYAGGQFATAGGNPARYIAKWTGSAWSPLGGGVAGTFRYRSWAHSSPSVFGLTTDQSGHLYACGDFLTAGATPTPFIAQANIAASATAPDISVEKDASVLTSGTALVGFGTLGFSTNDKKTLTIRSFSNGPLANIAASFAPGSSSAFKITKAPGATVAVGQTTTLTVTYSPTANGPQVASLLIASNDGDENPFNITLTGAGVGVPVPDIALETTPTAPLADGDGFAFAPIPAHLSATQVFTIKNTGAASLTNVAVSFAPGSDAAFSLVTPPAPTATVAKNGKTTFAVRFTPGAVDTFVATLQIASNDPDEAPYEILLTGEGQATAAPLFVMPPRTQLVLSGWPTVFDATVTGAGNAYQWKKNGAAIAKATSNPLQFTAKTADAGAYTLFAKNAAGENTSAPAYLGVITPNIASSLQKEGATLTLNCAVTVPTGPNIVLDYEWRFNDNPITDVPNRIAGSATKALKLSNLALGDSGVYTCLVTMHTPTGDAQLANGNTQLFVVKKPTVIPPVLNAILVSETVNADPVTSDFAATYTATGLPPGVVLNKFTGLLSGKPTAAKSYKVKFTATNPAGTSLPVEVTWQINALDPSLIGTFNGIFARDAATNFGYGGTLQLTISPSGTISGSVVLAGQKYPATGVLDASTGDNPSAVLTVKRTPTALGNLLLNVTSIEVGGDRMSGTLNDPELPLIQSELVVGNGQPGAEIGPIPDARLNAPRALVLLEDGGFIADTGNHVIKRVANDNVEIHAGESGTPGATNGSLTAARFNLPEGMALDALGNLLVADTGNAAVRRITPAGVVSTLPVPAATFASPCALAFDDKGNLVIADRGNHTLVKITPAGVVSILAGKRGISGHKDGAGASALFSSPNSICFDLKTKAFYVADSANRVIRKVTPTGTVGTYAGSPGVAGTAPGFPANARFISPMGVASDGEGGLLVADTVLIYITPGGLVIPLTQPVDPNQPPADMPVAVAFDPVEEAVFAADAGLHAITRHESIGPIPGAAFTARRAIWTTAAPVPVNFQGPYSAAITTSQPDDLIYPQGHGYVTLVVKPTGAAAIAGKTADGAAITAATVVGPEGEIFLHQMLYQNTGSLHGMTFVDDQGDWFGGGTPAEPFDWFKLPQPLALKDRLYKGGILLHPVNLLGGKYTPPNNIHAFLGLTAGSTTGNASVAFTSGLTGAGLAAPITFDFNVKAPSAVTLPTTGNPNKVKLTFTPATGVFTGSFVDTTSTPAQGATVGGVLVRNTASGFAEGRGYFLLPTTTAADSPMLSGATRVSGN